MSTQTIGVFGASGQTGQHILHTATSMNIPTIAFVRSTLQLSATDIRMVNLADSASVHAALLGVDSVICAFGQRPQSHEVFCAVATQTIINAMYERGIRRLICLTGAMIGDYPNQRSWGLNLTRRLYQRQQPALAADRVAQEQSVTQSKLDWTIVKPPRLSNATPKGTYHAEQHLRVSLFSSITRADVATFLINLSQSNDHLHQRVFVRN